MALRGAANEVSRYAHPFCVDLYDFVNLAQKGVKAKITEGRMTESEKTRAFDRSAESLKTYLAGQLVLSNFTQGSSHGGRSFSESRGISIYVPDIWTYFTSNGIHSTQGTGITSYSLETKYTDLEFDRITGWSKFAQYLIKGHPK